MKWAFEGGVTTAKESGTRIPTAHGDLRARLSAIFIPLSSLQLTLDSMAVLKVIHFNDGKR